MAFVEIPLSLDPTFIYGYVDNVIGIAVYDTLVWVDPSDLSRTLQPRLATSWEANDDFTSWTFQLREGVQFHHGTPFTAQDVVYTFERILDPDLGATANSIFKFVDVVEAVDDFTVRFDLKTPHASLPNWLLAENATLIVPHDRSPDEMATQPSGTGPFRFVSYDPAVQLSMTRNDAYWQADIPYLDEVHLVFISDLNTQIAALVSGTIDVMTQVGIANVATLEAAPSIDLLELEQGTYDVFVMNCQMAPFDDVRVRQAFKLMVDRAGLQQVVLRGKGELGADQPFPSFSPYWAESPIPERDIAEAKALLAEAGYANGLDVTLTTTDISPGIVDASVALQEMAKGAGINISLERVPPDTYWVDYYRQSAFFVSVWPTRIDPGPILMLQFTPGGYFNEANWDNEEIDSLLTAAQAESDPARLKEIYGQIQALIQREGGSIIPYFRPLIVAKRLALHGLAPDLAVFDVRSAWMEQG